MSRKFYYDPDSYTVLINFFNQNFNKIIGYELTKEENKQGYFYKLKDVSKNNIVLFNKSVNKSSNKKTKDNKLTTINLEKKEIVSDIIYNSKSINPNEFYIPLCGINMYF